MEGRGLRRAKGIVRGAGGEVKEIGGLKLGQSRRIPRVKAMNQKQIEGFRKLADSAAGVAPQHYSNTARREYSSTGLRSR